MNALLETYSAMTGLERTQAFAKSKELRVSFGADGISLKPDKSSAKSEKNQTTNRIDVHLVDITDTVEDVDASKAENFATSEADHIDLANKHENVPRKDTGTTDISGMPNAKRSARSSLSNSKPGNLKPNDSNSRVGLSRRGAANDRAFEQTHLTEEQDDDTAAISVKAATATELNADNTSADTSSDAEFEESTGFAAMADAEEAAQTHAVARAEAIVQLEAAAQAAAYAEEAASAEAELMFETLSESALIEAELIEEFANMDPTLDADALDAIVREANLTQDLTGQLEEELVNINSSDASESEIVVSENVPTDQRDTTPDVEAESTELADTSDSSADSTSELVVQSVSEQFPTTADYDSLEVDLDETNADGFGGLPASAVSTRPQGYVSRLWRAVRRAARNIIRLPMTWFNKRK